MSGKVRAFKRLYDRKRMTLERIKKAVDRKFITAEEYKEITGESYL